MRKEQVEIYSDATNAAIVRHPERKFPGVLVQGDTLHVFCYRIDLALEKLERDSPAYHDLNKIRNSLWDLKNHYKAVLAEHEIPLPFDEI